MVARVPIDRKRELLAGDRGERWLVQRRTARATAQAAAELAPEDLISILALEDGGWLFVGRSGTGYEAREPLGPFVRSTAPLDPLIRVSAAASAILAVQQDGSLSRSVDAGVSWQAVGPTDTRFADVALLHSGRGLALAVPEQFWRTEDAGATWQQVQFKAVGAVGFERDQDAGLVVQGVLGWYSMDDAATGLVPLQRSLRTAQHPLPVRPPRGPDAAALASGRATFVSGYYLELEPDRRNKDGWRLWQGAPDAGLRSVSLRRLQGCRDVRIAGHDRWLSVACSRVKRSSKTARFVFYRSADHGKKWRPETFSAEGHPDELKLAVGAAGQLLVTGVCVPRSSTRGCGAQGILYRRLAATDAGAPEGRPGSAAAGEVDRAETSSEGGADTDGDAPRHELAVAATPALKGGAEALAFSTDGKTAYAVGRRTKNHAYALYVSHDAGRSFEARELEQLRPQNGDDDNYEEEADWRRRRYGRRDSRVQALQPAEDGSVAIVARLVNRQLLLVTDEAGRVLYVSRPPGQNMRIGAAGTRALAFSPTTREAWESVDGGAKWDSVGRLPADPCPGSGRCEAPVYCHLGGCVIGGQLSRLGWHGQADTDHGTLTPPARSAPPLYASKLRASISCALEEEPWRVLAGARAAPTADQAAIGEVVWFVPRGNGEDASAAVIQGLGGRDPRVAEVSLLRPVAHAERYAYAVWMQIEGVVAVRYPVASATAGAARLRNVEIAWNNLLEGRTARARVPDAGRLLAGDYDRESSGAHSALPELLSIGAKGVYVRIHRSLADGQETLFVDGRTVQRIPAVTWPEQTVTPARGEMAHIGSSHVPVLLIGAGTALVSARRANHEWSYQAFATGLRQPAAFGLHQQSSIAYVDGRSGRHLLTYDATGRHSRGVIFPFRADGAVVDDPVMVPMQSDTGVQPRHCSPRQRSSTPRVVVPYQPGTRHPVIVVDIEEPMRVLLTGQAVMYGTPAAACIAALDAEFVDVEGGPESQSERAILPLDDLEHSWLFRSVGDEEEGEQSRVEYRLMNCHFDKNVLVPPEVYEAPGTRIRR